MTPNPKRAEALVKLAVSRQQLREFFEEDSPGNSAGSSAFPRSATMRLLSKGGGKKTLEFIAMGLLAARPSLLKLLLRYVSAGAISKILSKL
jgi:hypothetical protein